MVVLSYLLKLKFLKHELLLLNQLLLLSCDFPPYFYTWQNIYVYIYIIYNKIFFYFFINTRARPHAINLYYKNYKRATKFLRESVYVGCGCVSFLIFIIKIRKCFSLFIYCLMSDPWKIKKNNDYGYFLNKFKIIIFINGKSFYRL